MGACAAAPSARPAQALGRGDELLRHHVADGLVEVPLEADVAVGQDADRKPSAATTGRPEI